MSICARHFAWIALTAAASLINSGVLLAADPPTPGIRAWSFVRSPPQVFEVFQQELVAAGGRLNVSADQSYGHSQLATSFGRAAGRVTVNFTHPLTDPNKGETQDPGAGMVAVWQDAVTIHPSDPALIGMRGRFTPLYDVPYSAATSAAGLGPLQVAAGIQIDTRVLSGTPPVPFSGGSQIYSNFVGVNEFGQRFPSTFGPAPGVWRTENAVQFIFGQPFVLQTTLNAGVNVSLFRGRTSGSAHVDLTEGVTWGGFFGGVFDSANNPVQFRMDSAAGIDWSKPSLIPWNVGGTNDYATDTNWVFGKAPTSSQSVLLGRNSTYSISIINTSNPSLIARAGDITLNATKYNLTRATADEPSLLVGEFAGRSPRLTLAAGEFSSVSTVVGQNAGSDGELRVSGAGSMLKNSQQLYVGYAGEGEVLVAGQGRVDARELFVARDAGSLGALRVEGTNSKLLYTDRLVVGDAGTASLMVTDGARLENLTVPPAPLRAADGEDPTMLVAEIGSRMGSSGEITVRGAASEWLQPLGEVIVGKAGEAKLNVLDRGKALLLTVGAAIDPASKATMAIDGSGSELQYLGRLSLGQKGLAEMTVRTGGKLEDGEGALVFLGEHAGGEGRFVATGAGSQWSGFGSKVEIGSRGRGTIDVVAGGRIELKEALLGAEVGGVGTINIAGGGTTALVAGLGIGQKANGEVTVKEGASLETESLRIGVMPGSVGSMVVEGAGSKWTERQLEAVIGDAGDGSLTIRDNAMATLSQGASRPGLAVAKSPGGKGRLRVTGGAKLEGDTSLLSVGVAGQGEFELTDNSQATVHLLHVGVFAATGAGTLKVQGAGSVLHTTLAGPDSFQTPNIVGGKGTAQLDVLDGGQVRFDANLVIGSDVGGRGIVHLNRGSSMTVTSDDPAALIGNYVGGAGTGELGVFSGSTFSLQGRMTVGGLGIAHGNLVVRNPGSSARLTGQLYVGRSGSADALGNLLVGDGGKLTAPEIRITPRGTLSGDGLIEGTIHNAGTVRPGSSPGKLTVVGDYLQAAGGILELEIGGLSGGIEHDQLSISGNAALGGSLLLDFIGGFAPRQGQQFALLDAGGAINGSFADSRYQGLMPGFEYRLASDGGRLTLTALNDAIAIPEPSSAVLASLSAVAACLLALHRRWK